jgi:hypothetical protein
MVNKLLTLNPKKHQKLSKITLHSIFQIGINLRLAKTAKIPKTAKTAEIAKTNLTANLFLR